MKSIFAYSHWHFVAYCISTLTMAATLVGCSSLDAWYYDNILLHRYDDYGSHFSIGFGIMSMFAGMLCVWSIISLVEFIAKKTAQRRSLKIYVIATLVGQLSTMVVIIVMLCILGVMAYYIFVLIWMFLNLIIGGLALRSPKRPELPPSQRTIMPPFNFDSNNNYSQDSKENEL